jgi:polysaccharide export outer membrane protein
MAFTNTATHAGKEIKLPRMFSSLVRLSTKTTLTMLGWSVLFPIAVAAQYAPAPKVGGTSTFDSATGPTGNEAATARHRLTPLAAVPEDFSTLKLAPGFLLSMEVYDTPEYSLELRVDAGGDVNLPMIGKVHIADTTLVEASSKIAAALRDGKILNNPSVNLNIEEYAGREVTVLGEVRTPGRVEMLAQRHLDDVIAMAGGETEFAGKTIEIRHETGAEPRSEVIHYSRNTDNHILSDTVVRPGDTVTVKRAGIVYVLGGVTRPGGYLMQEDGDLNVTQALALAYGTTMPAAVGSMRLIRKKDDGMVEEIPIPYHDIIKGKLAPMRLQAEDVIYVPISKAKVILGTGLMNTAVAAAVIYR